MDTETILQVLACADEAHTHISSIRVAIVEDMLGIAQMLFYFCQRHWGLNVVSLAHTGVHAFEGITRTKPDVILLGLGLPDADSVALAGRINTAVPDARIIVISGTCCDYHLYRLGEVEIHGFVDNAADGLLSLRQAIALVNRGETYFSPRYLQASRRLRRSETAYFKLLSKREQEVLLWIARALSDDEIADQLDISAATAKTHRREIMRKLNVPNTPKLIRYGLDLGMGGHALFAPS
jgi:two-component system response regulator NreC